MYTGILYYYAYTFFYFTYLKSTTTVHSVHCSLFLLIASQRPLTAKIQLLFRWSSLLVLSLFPQLFSSKGWLTNPLTLMAALFLWNATHQVRFDPFQCPLDQSSLSRLSVMWYATNRGEYMHIVQSSPQLRSIAKLRFLFQRCEIWQPVYQRRFRLLFVHAIHGC